MHDFWYKAIPLEDIKGTEFHFSHYSNSSRVVRRFHHFFSVIMFLISMGFFALLTIFGDSLSENEYATMLIFGICSLISAGMIYYFASQFSNTIPISDFGKKRLLKIGYFDQLHQRHLVLELLLEDSQTIVDTVDWIKVLDSNHQTEK